MIEERLQLRLHGSAELPALVYCPGLHGDWTLIGRFRRALRGRVRFVVSDNGVGIPAENLNRIFTHGFTTRRDGHGFGLHGGAITAKNLGGSLQVSSEGPGMGATFILELPLVSPS